MKWHTTILGPFTGDRVEAVSFAFNDDVDWFFGIDRIEITVDTSPVSIATATRDQEPHSRTPTAIRKLLPSIVWNVS